MLFPSRILRLKNTFQAVFHYIHLIPFMLCFSGTLELNLNHMPGPSKKSGNCSLDQLPDVEGGKSVKMISLFEQKRARGYWPCYNDESGTKELTVRVTEQL